MNGYSSPLLVPPCSEHHSEPLNTTSPTPEVIIDRIVQKVHNGETDLESQTQHDNLGEQDQKNPQDQNGEDGKDIEQGTVDKQTAERVMEGEGAEEKNKDEEDEQEEVDEATMARKNKYIFACKLVSVAVTITYFVFSIFYFS